jgi:hypothetical protein
VRSLYTTTKEWIGSGMLHNLRILRPICTSHSLVPSVPAIDDGPLPLRPRVRQSLRGRIRPTHTARPIRTNGRLRRRTTTWVLSQVLEVPKEFWYNGARNGTGCTSFPKIIRIGGHNSQKHGTEPGICGGSSTGIYEVIFSNIWIAKVRAG